MDVSPYWIVRQPVAKFFVDSATLKLAEAHLLTPIDANSVMMREMSSSFDWLDTWYLRRDPARGILEYQDTYPTSPPHVLAAGYEIPWGAPDMAVGDVISRQIHVDPEQSKLSGDATSWGWQTTKLVSAGLSLSLPGGDFSDVIEVSWSQSWCADSTGASVKTDSATYFLAPLVGLVRMDWPSGSSFVVSSIR